MRNWSIALVGVVLLVGVALPAQAERNWPEERVMSESFDAGAGGNLRVEVSDADLDLRVGSGANVSIEVHLASPDLEAARAWYERMNFRAEANGGTIALQSDPIKRSWSGRDHVNLRVRAVITLPEQYDIDLTTGDGDVQVERSAGTVRLKTSDGDVEIGRIDGPDAVVTTSDGDVEIAELRCDRAEIRTSDGDIVLGRFDGGRLELRTSDGDISIEQSSGRLQARTSDGDIDVGFDRFDETTLATSDGDIAVRASAGLAADLEFTAEHITLPPAGFKGRHDEHSVQGTLNGGGPALRVSARDGTVALKTL